MENQITPEIFQETKRKTKEFYGAMSPVWCPALKDYVDFNSAGFRHLLRQGKWLFDRLETVKNISLAYFKNQQKTAHYEPVFVMPVSTFTVDKGLSPLQALLHGKPFNPRVNLKTKTPRICLWGDATLLSFAQK